MEEKIIEYFGRPDSGCWGIEAGADHITFRSIWGDGMITFPGTKREDVFLVQTTGAGSEVLRKALGRSESLVVIKEDGLEISIHLFLKRERKVTESTDILKEFVEECTNRHITNVVKSGYISFQIGGEEEFTLRDGNKIKVTDRYNINLAQFAKEIMDRYCEGDIDFYINSDGIICE